MFSGEEEVKADESEGEVTEMPEGEDITYLDGQDTYERENELACRLESVHEKLQEEVEKRKALEDLIQNMRKSFEDQKEIFVDRVAALETKPGKSHGHSVKAISPPINFYKWITNELIT